MKQGVPILAIATLYALHNSAHAAPEPEQTEVVVVSAGDKFLRWNGKINRTYFIQAADPNAPLRQWVWMPVIEYGSGTEITHEIVTTADKAFFRIWFTDDQPPDGTSLEDWDADNDGLSNEAEINTHQTNPLDPDTDKDTVLDGEEVSEGTDPNNQDSDNDGLTDGEEKAVDTDPNNPDSDGDGITDGGELDQGTDPSNPNDTPDAEWVILIGDFSKGVQKSKYRSLTIPAGESRLIIVASGSDEYDLFTADQSQWNDLISWNVTPSQGIAIQGNGNVNARHDDWAEAEALGISLLDYAPVHTETIKILTAPDDHPITVDVALTATNISDGALPSYVFCGLLPIHISEVSFSGDKYWELWSDKGDDSADGGVTYSAPHWTDHDGNGMLNGEGERNYPIAFTRGAGYTLDLSVDVKLPSTLGLTPEASMEAPGPSVINLASLSEASSGRWNTGKTSVVGNLPDVVSCYVAQIANEEFTIQWKIRFKDTDSWLNLGDTNHTVYLTFSDPINSSDSLFKDRRQETIFNIGCRNGEGHVSNANNILVDAIYTEFTDREIARVEPTTGILREEVLTYWNDWKTMDLGDVPDAAGVNELLASNDGDGSCGAFASLLNHIVRSQGIPATMASVAPAAPANILMIKEWEFTVQTYPGQPFPFKVGVGAVPLQGMPGQGNPDPPNDFSVHIITSVENYLYDPSYGTPRIPPMANGLPNAKAYEAVACSGFGLYSGDGVDLRANENTISLGSPAEVTITNIGSEDN